MIGLPQGQFVDYVIIALVGSVIAGIAVEFIKKGTVSWGRALFAVALVALCVVARFKYIQGFKPKISVAVPEATLSHTPQPNPSPAGSPEMGRTPKQVSENALPPRYIAPPPKSLRKAGQWSVIIADSEGHEEYPKLADTVSSVLSEKGQSTAAIFRPAATRGPGFESLFAADPAVTRQLNRYCDKVLLGRVVSTEKQNPISPGLLSLTLTLSGKIISTRTGDIQHEFELSAVGAGYSTEEAKTNAEDTLATSLRSELLKAIQ